MVLIITTIFFVTIVAVSRMKKIRAAESRIMKDAISYTNIGLTMCDGKKEDIQEKTNGSNTRRD
jgi:hypothetical protein